MSVRFVGRVGQQFDSAAASTSTVTTTTAIPVGQFLILATRSGLNHRILSITDSSNNTWVQLGNSALVQTVASVWYSTVTTAIAASSTITVTFTGSSGSRSAAVWAFDGITRPTTTSANARSGSATTSLTVGNVTPSQYASLMFSAGATNANNTFSVSAGWTVLPVTTASVVLNGAYAIRDSMDALGTTWTFGSSAATSGAVSGTFTPDGGDMLAIF